MISICLRQGILLNQTGCKRHAMQNRMLKETPLPRKKRKEPEYQKAKCFLFLNPGVLRMSIGQCMLANRSIHVRHFQAMEQAEYTMSLVKVVMY